MRKFKFYDKPGDEPLDAFTADEFRLWQCGYRRASVNMVILAIQLLALGIYIGVCL